MESACGNQTYITEGTVGWVEELLFLLATDTSGNKSNANGSQPFIRK